MQFTESQKAATRDAILPTSYDQVLGGSPTLLRVLGNAQPWGSGLRKEIRIKWKRSNLGGVTGIADRLSTERSDNFVRGYFEPRMIVKPVVVAKIETTLNKGDQQVVEILAREFDSMAQELIEDTAAQLWSGSGAGNNWDSHAMAADDATNYGTYATLARATYTAFGGYLATSIGALALSDLSTGFDNTTYGQRQPTLVATTKSLFSSYEGLLQPSVRMNISANGYPMVTRTGMVSSQAGLGGDLGFQALAYRGTPIVADEQVPSGELRLINEKTFFFAGIDIDGEERPNIKGNVEGPMNVPVPRGFNWSGLKEPVDQKAEVGHVSLAGNFIGVECRTQGRLTGAS